MVIFEVTIQHRLGDIWPVIVDRRRDENSLPIRSEGELMLDLEDLHNQANPKEYGTVLGKALFQDDIRDTFVRAQADSESEQGLRIILTVEAPRLTSLYWGRLCFPMKRRRWKFLSQDQRFFFSLYLSSEAERTFQPIDRSDLRALVLIANPAKVNPYNLPRFDAEAMRDSVQNALGKLSCDVLGSVQGAIGPSRLPRLYSCLSEQSYPLLHIVAHGWYRQRDGETVLYLTGGGGQVEPVTATELIARLDTLRELPYFVFLSTCESAKPEAEYEGALGGLAQRLVRELGIPNVVAMTEKISIAAAKTLTEHFYTHFCTYGEADRALSQAFAHVDRNEVIIPILYSRPGSRPLFSETTVVDEVSKTGFTFIKPSWIENYPNIQPVLFDDETRHILQGFTPFPNHRAEFEQSFLFGDMGGFWSGHPMYATIATTFQPQVVLADKGGGKTAFAYALQQVGNADATPLPYTLPILLTEDNAITLINAQNQIVKSILALIRGNPSAVVRLNPNEKKFIVGFLVNQLGTKLVQRRLSPVCEQDESLPGIIERFQQTSPRASKAWLGRTRDTLEYLGFKRVLLAIDANRQPAGRIRTWLQNLQKWGGYSINPVLFLPLDRRQEFDQLLGRANVRVLAWTENQLTQMAKWRFERLAIWTNTFMSIEDLFDGDLFFDFVRQANHNPRRLALLWRHMFEHHQQLRPDHRTFTQDDLDSAVEQLK